MATGTGAFSIRSYSRAISPLLTTAARVFIWRMRAWAPSVAARSIACSIWSTTTGSMRPLTWSTSTGCQRGDVAGGRTVVAHRRLRRCVADAEHDSEHEEHRRQAAPPVAESAL